MNAHLLPMLTVATSLLMSGSAASAGDADAIRTLLKGYETALNASDTDGVMKLYADDGVFMAQHNDSAVGRVQVEAAYDAVFEAIDLNVVFDVAEIEVIASDWAFARSNSSGTITLNATGDEIAESNQELFLLRRVDGDWKIARYAFSTTNPPR